MTTQPWVPVDPPRLDANWRVICAELDAPQPSRLERMLRRIGFDASSVRLAVATPSLRRSWYAALAVVVVLGLAAADREAPDPEASLFTLLFAAPLVPILGVALAYGPGGDPAYEATLSTPRSGLRLVLIRTAVVVIVSVIALGIVGLLSPVRTPMAWAWIVPSVATSVGTLAVSTFLSPRRAGAVVGSSWIALVLLARAATNDRLAAFSPAGQVVAVLVVGIAAGVVAARRSAFSVMSGEWA